MSVDVATRAVDRLSVSGGSGDSGSGSDGGTFVERVA